MGGGFYYFKHIGVMLEDDPIQEFGSRVMEEVFRTFPCEKVFIKRYAPGENRL